eukprot:gene24305-9909_t
MSLCILTNELVPHWTTELFILTMSFFEKGAQLRVPEIVPFRLTQALGAALGATGPEGMFRIGCETAMGVLRSRREAVVSLLDAMLADPLVEWSAELDDAATRKNLDLAVSLNLFTSRVEEAREQLQQQVAAMLWALDHQGSSVFSYVEAHNFLSAIRGATLETKQRTEEVAAMVKACVAAKADTSARIQAISMELSALAVEAQALQAHNFLSALRGATLETKQRTEEVAAMVHACEAAEADILTRIQALSREVSALAVEAQALQGGACIFTNAVRSPVMDMGSCVTALGTALPAASPMRGVPCIFANAVNSPVNVEDVFSPELLNECKLLDTKAAASLQQRESLLTDAASALEVYVSLLRNLLPSNCVALSHDHKWSQVGKSLPGSQMSDKIDFMVPTW